MLEEVDLAELSFRIVQEDLVGAGSNNQYLKIHDFVLYNSSQLFYTQRQNQSFEAFRILKVDARSQLSIELIDGNFDVQIISGAFFNEVDEILTAIGHIIPKLELIFEVDAPLLAQLIYLPVVDLLKNCSLLHRHQQGVSQPHSFHCVAAQGQHAWILHVFGSCSNFGKETAEILLGHLFWLIRIFFTLSLVASTVLTVGINVALISLEIEVFDTIHIKLADDKWVLSHVRIFSAGCQLFGKEQHLVWIAQDGIII